METYISYEAALFTDFENARSRLQWCTMRKLSNCLVIGRASYERWLGTEPQEIAAAAAVLRELEPRHPSLVDLDVRLRRARQIRPCSPPLVMRSWRAMITGLEAARNTQPRLFGPWAHRKHGLTLMFCP